MTLSMALMILLPKPPSKEDDDQILEKPKTSRDLNRFTLESLAVTAFSDLLSGWCIYAGLLKIGGGVFVVIYSSTSAWTALISHFKGNFLT